MCSLAVGLGGAHVLTSNAFRLGRAQCSPSFRLKGGHDKHQVLRAAPLVTVKTKFTVKNAVCMSLPFAAYGTVNLAFTPTSILLHALHFLCSLAIGLAGGHGSAWRAVCQRGPGGGYVSAATELHAEERKVIMHLAAINKL